MNEPDTVPRLAVYGSLAPGKRNHHQLAALPGQWSQGTVRGRLIEEGWGATMGFPALVLDGDGPSVAVQVFESLQLPGEWKRLDEFEGSEYERVLTEVESEGGTALAYIYVARGGGATNSVKKS